MPQVLIIQTQETGTQRRKASAIYDESIVSALFLIRISLHL